MAFRTEVRTNVRTGHHYVAALFRPPMEDMWETATHVATFEDREVAEALARRVLAAHRAHPEAVFNSLAGLNLDYWQGPTSLGSPIRWDAKAEAFHVAA